MKKRETEMGDELRAEYDLRSLRVRKLGRGRKGFGGVVRLEPDVAEVFPDADAVNEALRFLIRVTRENQPVPSPDGDADRGMHPTRSSAPLMEDFRVAELCAGG